MGSFALWVGLWAIAAAGFSIIGAMGVSPSHPLTEGSSRMRMVVFVVGILMASGAVSVATNVFYIGADASQPTVAIITKDTQCYETQSPGMLVSLDCDEALSALNPE